MTHPGFRRLFLANTVSRAGDAFNVVALVVLVFGLTGSGLGVALTVAVEVIPVLFFGVFAGLIVDRFARRSVMIGADITRAALVAAIAVSSSSLVLVLGVAFGVSLATVLFNPASASLLPDLVESEDLVKANSLLWSTSVLLQIMIAPLAGVLIATLGVEIAFVLNALSYLVSGSLLVGLGAGRAPASIEPVGWNAALGGIVEIRARPLLRRLALAQMLAALSAGATSGLLVVLASERLGTGPSGFGLLIGAIGVGAALGALTVARVVRPGVPAWLFGPFTLRGLVDLGLATTTNAGVAGGLLATYGVSTSTGTIAFQSTLQAQASADRRGRTFALFDMIWSAGRLVSLMLGGLLADAFGVRTVYYLGGALLLMAAGVGLAPLGRNPRADGQPPG